MTNPLPEQETASLSLKGHAALACPLCADRLLGELNRVPGVASARLDVPAEKLVAVLESERAQDPLLRAEIARVTAEHRNRYGHETYRVSGMDCADCARSVEKTVASLPGVLAVSVNFAAAKMRVEYEPGTAGIGQVAPRLASLGFAAQSVHSASADTPPAKRFGLSETWRVALSGVLLLLGLLLERVLPTGSPVPTVVLGLSLVAGGYRFALNGIHALRTRTVGTNLLMAVAAVGAIFLRHWEEAAAVVFLYALGEALEGAAMDRTRRSLRSLIDTVPPQALVQRAGLRQESIPAAEVSVGDVLVLKPGARAAADGVVLSGASDVSEAAITGEAIPKEKGRGDTIYAGSVNGHGSMLVRVTAAAADTTLARILHLVEEAQAQKAPTQALVERFGRVYTPLVLVSAALLALVGPFVAPGVDWTYRALTLLVVSCPCALIISTPVAYVSGIARAARGGVLVKGGAYLEALAAARHLALDKTGTLTTGALRVTDVCAKGDEEEMLALAAAAERFSEHPIAAAVVAAAERRALSLPEAFDATAVPGRGIAARVGERNVAVGTAAYMEMRGLAVTDEMRACAARLEAGGKTILFVGQDTEILGIVAVADGIREESREAAEALRREGLALTMLTGDGEIVARAVGESVGIDDVRARLLPEDKLDAIRRLAQKPGGAVFVGDGINDAPALAAATVGVAMGGAGAAAALEAADIALMRDDLSRLVWAVRLAKRTRAIVRQNVVLSMGVVAALLATTVTGWLSLPLGVIGHEGSAILVILNGMRLLSPRLTRD